LLSIDLEKLPVNRLGIWLSLIYYDHYQISEEPNMKTIKKRASFIALGIILALSACSSKPAEPTVDANAVYTQAAATVGAQMTGTAMAMPTATAEPTQTIAPTDTLAPTATISKVTLPADSSTDATAQPGANATAQPAANNPTAQPIAPVATMTQAVGVIPTAGSSSQKAGDVATFAYNVPSDGKAFYPAEEFMLALGLVNSGSTTWTDQYKMIFLGGQAICREASVVLGKSVKPGDKAEFDFGCIAPSEKGSYVSRWKLTTTAGLYVTGSEIYFKYSVQ
jgi:hypothetical protein